LESIYLPHGKKLSPRRKKKKNRQRKYYALRPAGRKSLANNLARKATEGFLRTQPAHRTGEKKKTARKRKWEFTSLEPTKKRSSEKERPSSISQTKGGETYISTGREGESLENMTCRKDGFISPGKNIDENRRNQ